MDFYANTFCKEDGLTVSKTVVEQQTKGILRALQHYVTVIFVSLDW